MNHELVEKNVVWLGVLIVVAIAFGGLVEIVPLMFQGAGTEPAPGMKMRTPLQVAGRDVFVREGCYNCHSQMVRALHEEVLRYGPRSTAGESVWDHPFQWGSKRTGPDLARVGGRYSDDWHVTHLMNPRDVVPESNMPGYPWLAEQMLDGDEVRAEMVALKRVGVPFPDDEIAGAAAAVAGKTKMDALVAFLQSLKAPVAPQAADAETTMPAAGGAS
jgi:cytochrome c oxidase cbb3-type subunit 2